MQCCAMPCKGNPMQNLNLISIAFNQIEAIFLTMAHIDDNKKEITRRVRASACAALKID